MSGAPSQFFLNLPFGETMIDQTANTPAYTSPYKFNGKELDDSTGMYYYGARYYDPRISVWMSVDPLVEKYPSISPYAYCFNNPLGFFDPDGRDPIYSKNFWGNVKTIGDDGQKSTGSYLVSGSIARNVKAATKAGNFYTGSLSESRKVMHIPTGQIQKDVQQTTLATLNSGSSPETRVEHGGHSLHGDVTARIWDAGKTMQSQTLSNGSIMNKWTIKPLELGANSIKLEVW